MCNAPVNETVIIPCEVVILIGRAGVPEGSCEIIGKLVNFDVIQRASSTTYKSIHFANLQTQPLHKQSTYRIKNVVIKQKRRLIDWPGRIPATSRA